MARGGGAAALAAPGAGSRARGAMAVSGGPEGFALEACRAALTALELGGVAG